jgi:hypothetical protein
LTVTATPMKKKRLATPSWRHSPPPQPICCRASSGRVTRSGSFTPPASIKQDEEVIDPSERFKADPRSYAEVWKRWSEEPGRSSRSVTDVLGGRRVDGWLSPARHLLPENDAEEWPRDKDDQPKDPWQESAQIVLRRCSDGRLFTWSAIYGGRRGMGEILDIVAREAKDHPGCVPVIELTAAASGSNFNSKVTLVGWEPFGKDASPPANPARSARLREDLKRLQAKYVPKLPADVAKPKAEAGKRGDMDDEVPF